MCRDLLVAGWFARNADATRTPDTIRACKSSASSLERSTAALEARHTRREQKRVVPMQRDGNLYFAALALVPKSRSKTLVLSVIDLTRDSKVASFGPLFGSGC